MEGNDFLVLVISSGLIAGLVSTIGNVFIAIWNKRSDSKIEKLKHDNSLKDIRRNELIQLLDEALAIKDNFGKESKYLSQKEDQEYEINAYETYYFALDRISIKVCSLLDLPFQLRIQSQREKTAENRADALLAMVVFYFNGKKPSDKMAYGKISFDFTMSVSDLFQSIVDGIQSQIGELTV